MKPNRLNFGEISRSASAMTRKVELAPGDGGPLKPALRPVNSKGITAELREVEPGQRYEIDVTLNPPFESERVRTNLTLVTGIDRAPTVTIPVYARVKPRIEARPARITIPGNRKADWEQAVRVLWEDEAPHRILEVTTDDPGLTAKVAEENGQQQVTPVVPQGYSSRGGQRALVIKTDDPLQPEVRVPVTVRPSPRGPHADRAKDPLRNLDRTRGKRPRTGRVVPPDSVRPSAPEPQTDKTDESKAEPGKPGVAKDSPTKKAP